MRNYSKSLARRCNDIILKTSERLLQMDPDPVPKYLLLRDGLDLEASDEDLQKAKRALFRSRWVQQLRESQWNDGTWGRFHSQDTKAKQRVATTENGIYLALESGLDNHDELLSKTVAFITDHIDGKTMWRDKPEKHDNPHAWFVIIPYISAANLALIDNEHEKLEYFRDTWIEIVSHAFQGKAYDRKVEIEVSNRVLNCEMKSPPRFHTKYPLILLSSTKKPIDPELERLILTYVLSNPTGIYYMYTGKLADMPQVTEKSFYSWLKSQMILSHFPNWFRFSEAFVADILYQRYDDGLWIFSDRIARRPNTALPLSENWRRKENRGIDCTVMVLQLLRRYCQQALGRHER